MIAEGFEPLCPDNPTERQLLFTEYRRHDYPPFSEVLDAIRRVSKVFPKRGKFTVNEPDGGNGLVDEPF